MSDDIVGDDSMVNFVPIKPARQDFDDAEWCRRVQHRLSMLQAASLHAPTVDPLTLKLVAQIKREEILNNGGELTVVENGSAVRMRRYWGHTGQPLTLIVTIPEAETWSA